MTTLISRLPRLAGAASAASPVDGDEIRAVVRRSQAAAARCEWWFRASLSALHSLLPLIDDAKSRRHAYTHVFRVLTAQVGRWVGR